MNDDVLNKMMGCMVVHKSFGRGIVKSVITRHNGEGTIIIDFNEKKDTKFVFPSAFLNPNQVLRTNELQIVNYLDAHCRCAGCKELKKSDKGYERPYLCNDCSGKYQECSLCGHYKLRDSFKKLSGFEFNEPDQVCSDCYNEQCFTCEDCGKTYLKKYRPSNKYLKDDQQLCQSCLEYNFNECDNCGTYAPDEFTVLMDYRTYCQDCFENLAIKCERCGERFVPLASEHHCQNCMREISELAREKAYFEEWKKFDFNSRKIKELGFIQLKSTPLIDFMTKFHPKNEGKDGYYDILVLYGGGSGYVLINKKKTSFKELWPYACESYTMSQIKKDPFLIYFPVQTDYYQEAINLGDKYLKLWRRPICIGAHTRYDEDYRKEWIGGELVYEGDEYGATTPFYIIGEFVDEL